MLIVMEGAALTGRVALAAGVVALAIGLLGGSGGAGAGASQPRASSSALRVAIAPAHGGRHTRFTVALTRRHATGVFGNARHTYFAEMHSVKGASACVNNRDRVFADGPAGVRVRAMLDPARGEGGPLGWCPGELRGEVRYTEGYACPPAGTCHTPPGFPSSTRTVARFTVRVG
jgi:hypothetical protein